MAVVVKTVLGSHFGASGVRDFDPWSYSPADGELSLVHAPKGPVGSGCCLDEFTLVDLGQRSPLGIFYL